ncbi:MAG: hypothetical protein ACI8Z1_003270 [Candidatus Azotimanducaceae bacterium]|jgi:hypothetical protein
MMATLLFLLGIHMTMLLLAACYRIIDLWYDVFRYAANIFGRITLIILANVSLVLMLSDALLPYFIAGQVFYFCFHIVAHAVSRGIALGLERRLLKKIQTENAPFESASFKKSDSEKPH